MLLLLPFWGLRSFMRKNLEKQIQSAIKLRSKYIHISNGLIRTAEIAAELFQSEVITEKERDDIQHLLSTPVRANEQLLNTLMSKDSRAYDCFLKALSSTDQEHITEILKYDDKYLDTKHSLVIQRNYMTLIDNLDVDGDGLLDHLKQHGLITDREKETINARLTKHEKNETLLALVSKFSVDNFDKFLHALEDSSQEHVVQILTGKCQKDELAAFNSKIAESSSQRKHLKLEENLQQNPELQDDSNQNLCDAQQTNTLHSTKGTKEDLSLQRRKSIITFENKFDDLPDELQTELSLKVVTLRQKTSLPHETNMGICFLKLLKGFTQQTKKLSNKETRLEHTSEISCRENECAENFCRSFNDDHKAEIGMLNEELGWQRNNIHRLDELLTTTTIELLNEREKSTEFEKQLSQYQKNKEDLEKERDEHRKQLDEAKKMMEASRNSFEAVLAEKEKRRCEYKLDPVLVRMIKIKVAGAANKWISGMTILDKELFIVSEHSSKVEVYDSLKFSFSRRWELNELICPLDIRSCSKNNCLYIVDFKDEYQSSDILRVDPNGNLIKSWLARDDYVHSLSVTEQSNVILAVFNKNKVSEYSPDGQLIHEINLMVVDVHYLWHAVKLTNGDFMVSHGCEADADLYHYGTCNGLHRVCVVDGQKRITKSFSTKYGSDIGQMYNFIHFAVLDSGFVMVAEHGNRRVLLLDSDLKFQREILSKEKHRLREPHRILLDEANGRLLVADNETNDSCILIYDFKELNDI